MRAIIAGCGIAGPVAAIALQRAGIEATIYERRTGAAGDEGLFLSLASNGLRALEDLGLAVPLLQAEVTPTPIMVFLNSDARRLASVSMGRLGSGIEPVTLRRSTLHDVLAREARNRGIEMVFGTTVREFRTSRAGAAVLLCDGSEQSCDVLIGADGIHSALRGHLNNEHDLVRDVGFVNVGGFVERSGLEPTPGEIRMLWGRRAFFGYTVRPRGEAWWFANLGAASATRSEKASSDRWRAELLEQFADDAPFVCDLIGASRTLSAYPIHDVPSVPKWAEGSAVLIGDAAHATSPSSGQGASLAIEDAAYLAICLRDVADVAAALKHFETFRRSRAERIVAEGKRRGMYKAPNSAVSRWFRDLLLPLALKRFASEEALSWIYDYRVPQTARST